MDFLRDICNLKSKERCLLICDNDQAMNIIPDMAVNNNIPLYTYYLSRNKAVPLPSFSNNLLKHTRTIILWSNYYHNEWILKDDLLKIVRNSPANKLIAIFNMNGNQFRENVLNMDVKVAREISNNCIKISKILNHSKKILIKDESNNTLTFNFNTFSRKVHHDQTPLEFGLYLNLPIGEASVLIDPINCFINGNLIINAGIAGEKDDAQKFKIRVTNNIITIDNKNNNAIKKIYINNTISKIGIGLNPYCIENLNFSGDKKKLSKIHLCIGNNRYLGGNVITQDKPICLLLNNAKMYVQDFFDDENPQELVLDKLDFILEKMIRKNKIHYRFSEPIDDTNTIQINDECGTIKDNLFHIRCQMCLKPRINYQLGDTSVSSLLAKIWEKRKEINFKTINEINESEIIDLPKDDLYLGLQIMRFYGIVELQ